MAHIQRVYYTPQPVSLICSEIGINASIFLSDRSWISISVRGRFVVIDVAQIRLIAIRFEIQIAQWTI